MQVLRPEMRKLCISNSFFCIPDSKTRMPATQFPAVTDVRLSQIRYRFG